MVEVDLAREGRALHDRGGGALGAVDRPRQAGPPHASPASHAFLLSAGSATILLSWILARGKQGELRQVVAAPKGLLAGLVGFAVAALALQMVALQWLWVAVVETLKRAFGVFGSVVFGRLFFEEPITSRKLAAVVLMVAGTTLLALS